ncbi:MAG: 30S ribosomal protein S15 [Candidatus Peregrinibacteria bacterium]
MKRDEKKLVIGEHQSHTKDTGSFSVQIAIFTKKISQLTDHLKMHPKDKHSRRGLLQMVAKRRKLLTNFKKKSPEQYGALIEKLGLRG